MPEHEWFEELCALAAVGQVTEGELAVLQSHLRECPSCRQLKDQFVAIGALCLSQERHAESDVDDRQTELRHRVLKDLQGAGAHFSSPIRKELAPEESTFPTFDFISVFRQRTTWAYATALILVGGIGFAVGSYRHSYFSNKQNVATVQRSSPAGQDAGPAVPANTTIPISRTDEKIVESTTTNLREKLRASETARKTTETELAALKAKITSLQDARDRDAAEMAQLRTAGEADRNDAKLAAERLRKLEETRSAADAELVATQYQVRDLETKLSQQSAAAERERQMLLLASSSEMRDVIGARNLHIVDIYDTNTSGGRKRPFGRVFYVEGQSLVFYAYDLGGTTPSDTKITFNVWGETAGVKSAKTYNLGVLHSDDPGQSRWKLSFDDPKVLAKINAVYVTADSGTSPKSEPSGRKLMYAFLGSPNHP